MLARAGGAESSSPRYLTTENNTKSPMSFASSKGGRRRRRHVLKEGSPGIESGNDRKHITIVVFKGSQQAKGSKSHDHNGFKAAASGGIKKINSRGVPLRKPDGRLKDLRIANSPGEGLV